MSATNYFKVNGPVGERVFPFDHWRSERIRAAYKRATSCRGRMSVFYPVPLSGPWDSLPAILPRSAPLPQVKRSKRPARPTRSLGRVAMFGEGGCF